MYLSDVTPKSLVAQMVKNLTAMHETQVWSLVWDDTWIREWLPAPVFLPGESHRQRSLAGYSPWHGKVSDMTDQLALSLSPQLPVQEPENSRMLLIFVSCIFPHQ